MADPVVGITNGVPTSGTGTITTLGQTLVDGANATMGITTGAAVVTDASGTFQQYLRGLVKLIAAAVAGGAGSLFTKITDGTNTVTVKAASTASVTATDSAAVVVMRPDSAGIIATGSAASPSTTLLSIAPAAVAAGGATNLHFFSVTSAPAAVAIKASAGTLYGVQGVNTGAAPVYLKLYNKAAASVTVGTDVPLVTIPIPTTATTGAGIAVTFPVGIAFGTAISYTFTNVAADNDATAVAVGTTLNVQFA